MARGEQVVRQWKVLLALKRSHQGMSAKEISDAVGDGRSWRTTYRDLQDLQAAGFPLAADPTTRRWRLLGNGEGGWVIPVTPEQVLALMMVEELLEPVQAGPLLEPLAELRSRLSALLTPVGRDFCADLKQWAVATLFAPAAYGHLHLELEVIQDAIVKQQQLRLHYAKPGEPAEERVVDPWAVWLHAGRLYLIAWCQRAHGTRLFAVQRIQGVELLDHTFEPPANFDPAALARESFGVFQGPIHAISLELAPEVAHLARERRYHPSQTVTELKGGRVRLDMTVGGLPEVAAWLAGFGGLARVLGPPELIEHVRRLHQQGLAAHEPA